METLAIGSRADFRFNFRTSEVTEFALSLALFLASSCSVIVTSTLL